MSATPNELAGMRRAIALSALGLATTSPNPPVGCVILDAAGRLVGEGYHERKGEAHAEAQALAAAGDRAVGSTAVVTLEPCNHHGRTPPCHQALLDAGVARVVIALLDPTSRGEGGAARLQAAGVEVEVGVLADEASLVLGPWLTALNERRPQVTWLYQLGDNGLGAVPEALAGPALRAGFDAVLYEDGHLEEGSPGSHGPGAFSLPRVETSAGPAVVLSVLYDGGVRSLLLDAGPSLAAPFLGAGSIDRVKVHVVDIAASGRPGPSLEHDWRLLPAGFRLERLRKVGRAVFVEAAYDPDGVAT